MSLTGTFGQNQPNAKKFPAPGAQKTKSSPPFSIQFSEDERARLVFEAGTAPLGTYIKTKLLGDSGARARRSGLTAEDRKAIAQALALLGHARLANNLNQLAHAANMGILPMTPETEAELLAALRDVRAIRQILLTALGMKAESAS
jgi:hypothetical protein